MASLPSRCKPLNLPGLQELLPLACDRTCKIYLVGGYLRDALIDRKPTVGSHQDFDFMVLPGGAVDFARLAADKLNAHFVLLDESNDTARLVTSDGACFDFAGAAGGTLACDINRRDFTINALAWDPDQPEELIDLVGGVCDIEKRIVRSISEQSLIDDPLRLLRAHRFAALLDFDIEESTREFIAGHAGLLACVAPERISSELFLMFAVEKTTEQIKAMAENGLLEVVFPELSATRRVTTNSYHHLGLFDHSIETLAQAELALSELPAWARESMAQPLSQGVSKLAATKLTALIHDIGKPNTWVITPEGKHTFIGHDKLGAEMCEPLARRLKWSRSVERFVAKLVRWHLRPGHLFHQGKPTDKARYRFYRTIGLELAELVLLALADFRATCGPGLQEGRLAAEANLFELLENYPVYQEGNKKESRFLDGNQLMKLLGIKPGPLVGEILEEILEAQVLGELKSESQAATLAFKLYREKYYK
jgi:putative nucleotidyltransferase with HDIG domain